jgi:hypothetical protein
LRRCRPIEEQLKRENVIGKDKIMKNCVKETTKTISWVGWLELLRLTSADFEECIFGREDE